MHAGAYEIILKGNWMELSIYNWKYFFYIKRILKSLQNIRDNVFIEYIKIRFGLSS